MSENEFVDIKGYENMYQINRKGQVKSLDRYIDNRYKKDGEYFIELFPIL